MQLLPSSLGLLVLAGSASAQYLARHETFDRRMSRVTWIGMSGQQWVSMEYGRAQWRPAYEALAAAKSPAQYPLGSGAWTTMHTTVDLAAGAVTIPRGRWYLGLHRDANAAWTIAFAAADKVDASGKYVGAFLDAKADLRLPMRSASDAPPADLLEISLAADKKVRKNVTLTVAWGRHRLTAELVAAVDERVHPGTPEFALSPKDKVVTTKSGLQYEVLKAGAGEAPAITDDVIVHYAGWLTDGSLFDSSYQRDEPSRFPLQSVVKGFAEGLQLMQPGATYRLTLPPDLAYGDRAMGEIPANSTLVFVVNLIGVQKRDG